MEYTQILDLIFDNLKKIIYPEEMLELDLKLSKQEILILFLIDRQGEIIMSQLADYINIPMSTATGIVDRLVKKKYLKRDRSETDRRIVVLVVSDEGKEVVNNIKKSALQYVDILFEALTEEEKTFLINLIPKVLNILSNKDTNSENNKEADKSTKVKKIKID